MIFDAIVRTLMFVFRGVLGLLPDSAPQFTGIGAGLGNALAGANSVFPVITLGFCIAAVLVVRSMILGVALVAWIWDKVPFTFK